MFDTVLLDGVAYQTNDAHNVLDTYEVRDVDGQRRLFLQTFELRSIPDDQHRDGPLAPLFHREDTGWRWCDAANGVLALTDPDPDQGALLLFVRDGVVVAQRRLEERFADGGLCLGHRWPSAEEKAAWVERMRARVDRVPTSRARTSTDDLMAAAAEEFGA